MLEHAHMSISIHTQQRNNSLLVATISHNYFLNILHIPYFLFFFMQVDMIQRYINVYESQGKEFNSLFHI
jgi:hypothetical protein